MLRLSSSAPRLAASLAVIQKDAEGVKPRCVCDAESEPGTSGF